MKQIPPLTKSELDKLITTTQNRQVRIAIKMISYTGMRLSRLKSVKVLFSKSIERLTQTALYEATVKYGTEFSVRRLRAYYASIDYADGTPIDQIALNLGVKSLKLVKQYISEIKE